MHLYRVIPALCLIACIALAASLAWVLAKQQLDPPPFTFSQPVYAPDQDTRCPGQTLTWRPKLIVDRVPAMLAVSRTIWNVTQRTTIKPGSQLDFFVWTESDKNETLSRATHLVVPALPAGVYEVRTGASDFNSAASAYRVPFVVPESCFKGGKK